MSNPLLRSATARTAFVRGAFGLLCAAAVLTSCRDALVEPATRSQFTTSLSLSFIEQGTQSSGSSAAFDKADGVIVRVAVGGATHVDTLRFASQGAETVVPLSLPGSLAGQVAQLHIELRSGPNPLFRGDASLTLQADSKQRLTVPLAPVPTGLRTTASSLTMTSIGDTTVLGSAVVFATGDTVTGAAPTWSSLDASVLSVSPQGIGIARAEGQARAVASFAGFTDTVTIQVRAVVTRISISPASPQPPLALGSTRQLSAQAFDARENPLARSFTWTSSAPTIVSVSSSGLIRALASGQAMITAATENLTATTTITVPQAVGSVTGTVRHAQTNAPVANALVQLISPNAGQIVGSAQSNAQGSYSMTAPAGTYRVTASGTDFIEDVAESVAIQAGQTTIHNIVLSPRMAAGSTRIVLTWDARPRDLDLWMTGRNDQGNLFTISYMNPGSSSSYPFAHLDIDVVDGHGPETITIHQQFSGAYCVSVHNFSGETPLSSSGAQVRVYRDNRLAATYGVPNQSGTVWSVVRLQGDTLTPINQMSSGSPPGGC
jgi:hypothetical protein